MSSVRERLEELNRQCESICLNQSNWTEKSKGVGPKGTPNFRLIYSSPETFETPGGVMLLGTNPGGDNTHAEVHPPWLPFEKKRYSSYLDDSWAGYPRGQFPMQRAVQAVAATVVGRNKAEELLRTSPTGNLIPFRSDGINALPSSLRRMGQVVGWELVRLAKPRLLILLSSNQVLWNGLMAQFGRPSKPDWDSNLGANFIVREATFHLDDDRERFVFALPGLNTSTQGRTREVLGLLTQRLAHHGLALR